MAAAQPPPPPDRATGSAAGSRPATDPVASRPATRAPQLLRDPRVLRALAHPIRNQILGIFNAVGPLRAADVAEELGIAPNLASFHLRQLAKYGLIQEAPEAARDKRDRVWKLVDQDGLMIDGQVLSSEPGGRAAMKVYRRAVGAQAHELIDRASAADPDPTRHMSMHEAALKLTRAEGRQLADEIEELLHVWSERTRGRDPERSTYTFFGLLAPTQRP